MDHIRETTDSSASQYDSMQNQKTNYSQDYTGPYKISPPAVIFKTHLTVLPSLESPTPSQSQSVLPYVSSPLTLKICWSSLSSTALSCYPNGSCHFSFQAPSKTPVLNTVLGHNQPQCPLWGPILCQFVHNPGHSPFPYTLHRFSLSSLFFYVKNPDSRLLHVRRQ